MWQNSGMNARARLLAATAVLAVCAAPAARANDIDVVVGAKVAVGEQPKLTVNIHKDLKSASLDVKAPGSRHRQTLGPAPAGGALVFLLPHKAVGQLKWTGTLSVEFDDGAVGTMPVTFSTEVAGTLKFKVLSSREDVVRDNKVRLTMERPAGAIDVEVTGDDGVLIANQSKKLAGEAPGTELEIGWVPRTGAQIMKVTVVVHDTTGMFSPEWNLYPWTLEIPHEEVNFESGKSVVLATEEPKLTSVLPEVQKAFARCAKIKVPAKLFILGHTDTVGGNASNRTLSFARAQAIARWFKAHGITAPIYARGLGEDQLKVDTPDETDALANRRADYVLDTDGPLGGLSGWTRVD